MSNVLVHAAVAVPFALAGEWAAAAVCVAPDLTWVPNEWRYRRSGRGAAWNEWVERDGVLNAWSVHAYRLAHSWFTPLLLLPLEQAPVLLLAYYSHLLLDLFTHTGLMRQRPLYPFTQWRWPWAIAR